MNLPRLARSAWLCAALLSVVTVSLSAAPVENAQITAATVYGDRAQVERQATFTIPAGESEWTWERLPAAVIDDSVRIAGVGEAAITVVDVTTRTSHVPAATDPRVAELESAIKREQATLSEIAQREKTLEQQRALLGKIETAVTAPPGKDTAGSRPAFDEWQKLLNFGEEQRQKFASAEAALKTQRDEANARLAALLAQLSELQGRLPGNREYKSVTVRLSAAAAGSANLKLTYLVDGASWQPRYDARLNSKTRTVELGYQAIVRQTTGEDWKNVRLTLSTAQPGLGGAVPELTPWWVQVAQPRPAAIAKARGMSEEVVELAPFQTSADKDEGYRASSSLAGTRLNTNVKDVASAVTVVDTQATSASFLIEAPATVLSDNSAQRVSITKLQMPAELLYQAAPKLQETAFLTGTVTNNSDFPLLTGQVSVFLDEAFVASSWLKSVMPKEKFDLTLGADEGIAIKRQVVAHFQEDTGLTSKGRRVTYEFVTTVTNKKGSTEKIVVREALPLSQNEKISVKLLTPPDREIGTTEKPRDIMREENGKLAWTLTLKPGEKRELPLKFSVEWPADVQVVGIE